jgi:hypothetical protein
MTEMKTRRVAGRCPNVLGIHGTMRLPNRKEELGAN